MSRRENNYFDNRDLVLSREELTDLYERGKSPVAFIDETLGTSNDEHEQPFYLITAVVVEREDLESLRGTLEAFATEPNYFHATKQYSIDSQRIKDFLQHINKSPVESLVTVQTTVQNGDLEQARNDCLVRLAFELDRGSDPVQHLIVESLNQSSHPGRNHKDQLVLQESANRGVIGSEMSISHTSPYKEKLLWLPDVVSWAVRQELVRGNTEWVQNIENVRYVHAVGKDLTEELGHKAEKGIKKGRDPLLPQQSPGIRNVYGPEAGAGSVSSNSILEPILETYNRQIRDPEVMASSIAQRLSTYKPKPEDRLVAGVTRNNERAIVEGVNQYAREQVPEGTRPRKSLEALIDRVQAAPGTSKQAASAINDIRTRLEELKKNQVDQAKQGQPGRDDGKPTLGGHQVK